MHEVFLLFFDALYRMYFLEKTKESREKPLDGEREMLLSPLCSSA
jgi:hypothetical protein